MRRFYVFQPASRDPLLVRGEGVVFDDGSAIVRWATKSDGTPDQPERLEQPSSGWMFGQDQLEKVLAEWDRYPLYVDEKAPFSGLNWDAKRKHEEAAVQMATLQLEQVEALEQDEAKGLVRSLKGG